VRRYIGAFLAILVTAAVGLGLIAALNTLGQQPPAVQAQTGGPVNTSQGNLKVASITLQTYPFDPYEDPAFIASHVTDQNLNGEAYPQAEGDNPDWVKYWPTTQLVVPAHALVTITIQNFDGVTPLLNPYYAIPRGTIGNKISIDGVDTSQVNPEEVSHTFTIHSIPNATQPWLFVSVPVKGVADDAPADDLGMPNQPVVTQFSFMTGDPGQYIWQCFDPCGAGFNGFGGPMSTRGYMSGTFTVQ